MVSFLLMWGAERIIWVQVWFEKYSANSASKMLGLRCVMIFEHFSMIVGQIKIFIKDKDCWCNKIVGKIKFQNKDFLSFFRQILIKIFIVFPKSNKFLHHPLQSKLGFWGETATDLDWK